MSQPEIPLEKVAGIIGLKEIEISFLKEQIVSQAEEITRLKSEIAVLKPEKEKSI